VVTGGKLASPCWISASQSVVVDTFDSFVKRAVIFYIQHAYA
jgi:hypothetical protein